MRNRQRKNRGKQHGWGTGKVKGSMWVIAKEEEKWERQIFCLAFNGATEDMVGEEEAKPRVRQTEVWVGRRSVGSFGVSSLLPCGVLLGKGPCGPPRGEVHEAG